MLLEYVQLLMEVDSPETAQAVLAERHGLSVEEVKRQIELMAESFFSPERREQ